MKPKRLGKCRCRLHKGEIPKYYILQYKCWHPDGGFDLEECKSSQIRCLTCKATWRTKAEYVETLDRSMIAEYIRKKLK